MRLGVAVLVGGLLLALAGCSSGGSPAPTVTVPSLPSTATTPGPAATPSPAATPAVTPTSAAPAPATAAGPAPSGPSAGPDPVAFFRAQQAGCRAHAQATANPVVEPTRFTGAKRVRGLGGGATLIEDGRGTRLVVEPARGVVLPPSGRVTDAMPAPYSFGCSEKVFQGANAD